MQRHGWDARLPGQVGRLRRTIALVYPPELHSLDGSVLHDAIGRTHDLQYALYTRRIDSPPERLPSEGWISGGVRDLAMLVHRAAVSPAEDRGTRHRTRERGEARSRGVH